MKQARKQRGFVQKAIRARLLRYGQAGAVLGVLTLALWPAPALAQVCEMIFVPWIVFGIAQVVQGAMIIGLFAPSLDGTQGLLPGAMLEETKIVQNWLTGGEQLTSIDNLFETIPGVTTLEDIPGFSTMVKAVAGMIQNIAMPKSTGPDDPINLNIGGLGYMDVRMRTRLDRFWGDLYKGLKALTSQMHTADINNTRLLSSIHDAASMSLAALLHQNDEVKAKKQFIVSDETCQFDTAAKSLGQTQHLSRAVSSAYAQQVSDIGNTKKGTPGGGGMAQFINTRYQIFLGGSCDKKANNGHAPCPVSGAVPGAASSPSATVFGKLTMDVGAPGSPQRAVIPELVMNITGFTPPPLIPPGCLGSAACQETLLKQRGPTAQMDAVTGLIMDVLGDRMPGATSTDIQAVLSNGGSSDASATPSFRETIESVRVHLGDPKYYTNMGEAGGTIAQKELYLKAYNSMLLYRLIEKQEKISNAYAIETANMVAKYKNEAGQQGEHGF